MKLGHELKRLGKHSVIYGLGGLVSRILATLLLPLYTHYLPPGSYGRVEIVTAATAVLAIALQLGISSAFFRFYFDAKERAEKLTVIRTSFWFTMGMSTFGLVLGLVFAGPVSHWIGLGHDPTLVRAGSVGLWAQTNYKQLTSLFRVEERSTQYAIASVANVLITVAAMVLFVAVFHWGAVGLVVGNFTGTLIVYAVLVAYRSEQLGLEFDTGLFRKMQHFGMPLVPSALALWTINFVDREFIAWYKNDAEVGVYSAAVKIAGVIAFALVAFRTAWPAFAYSIEDDREAKRTYSFVLTYLLDAHVVGRARARRARAVVGAAPDRSALPARGEGRRAARVRERRLRGLRRARDRQRARATDAAELGRHGHRRGRERRPQLLARAGVRHGRCGDLHGSVVRRAVRRDDDVCAAACIP